MAFRMFNQIQSDMKFTKKWSRALPAVFAGMLFVPVAYADYLIRIPYPGILFTGEGAPTAPPTGPTSAVDFALSSTTLDLGVVDLGSSQVGNVQLQNLGSAAGTVSVDTPSAPFSLSHNCPAQLAAASYCVLDVTFTPVAEGDFSEVITVAGLGLTIRGTGHDASHAEWSASVSTADFGEVYTDSDDEKNVVLSNTGTKAGEVPELTVAAPFSVTSDCPTTLEIGESCNLTVKFTPTAIQTYDGALSFDGTSVALTGKGVAPSQIVQVYGGENFMWVHRQDGTWWAVGDNTYGQLGLGDNVTRTRLTKVGGISSVKVGPHFTYMKSSVDGGWYATGDNSKGQLGLGDNTNRNSFTLSLPSSASVAEVEVGGAFVFYRKSNNQWWATGDNQYGQLGLGNTTDRNTFGQVSFLTNATEVHAGAGHAFAKKNTYWYGTGLNTSGQLGAGNYTNKVSFARVNALDNAAYVKTADAFTYALNGSNQWVSTGANNLGQLGLGNTTGRNTFAVVPNWPSCNIVEVANGSAYCFNGLNTLYVTGANAQGQLGLGDTTNRLSFTQVTLPESGNTRVWKSYSNLLLDFWGPNFYVAGPNDVGQLGLGAASAPRTTLVKLN